MKTGGRTNQKRGLQKVRGANNVNTALVRGDSDVILSLLCTLPKPEHVKLCPPFIISIMTNAEEYNNNPQSRAWCITVNNYTEDNYTALTLNCLNASYYIIGKEIGEHGTPHLQCYFYLPKRKRWNQILKILQRNNIKGHVAIAKGTAEQNQTYCSKDGDYTEMGTLPDTTGGKMEIERWEIARSLATLGKMDEIPADIYLRAYSALQRIYQETQESAVVPDISSLENHWYWGPSGTGKSRTARENWPDSYLKAKNKWWGGYKFQDTVIIDDIDPSHATWIGAFLKEWSDHYRFNAETKGSGMVIRPKRIVVTSQYPIDKVFTDPETISALKRRFKTTHFDILTVSHREHQ